MKPIKPVYQVPDSACLAMGVGKNVDINFISIRKMIEIAIPDPDNRNLRCLLIAVAFVPTFSLFAFLFCSLLNSSSNWSSLSSFIR